MTTPERQPSIIVKYGDLRDARPTASAKLNPGLSYLVLERRSRIGGTWDLFRYPGTLRQRHLQPELPVRAVARGRDHHRREDIRAYLAATARKHGIEPHIRFDTHVHSADWDSSVDTWTVRASENATPRASCSSPAATTTRQTLRSASQVSVNSPGDGLPSSGGVSTVVLGRRSVKI